MKPNFDVTGKIVVITGGGGAICSRMAKMYADCGAKVAVLSLTLESSESVANEIRKDGGEALPLACDVLDKKSIETTAAIVMEKWGRVDILINGAGGNKPEATTNENKTFFDLSADAIEWVFNLNCLGTILTSQVFGKIMADQDSGVILNISSMNSYRPLTRVPAYSAGKAAVSNFTQWLAVDLAKNFSKKIRVNAIAPGFFIGNQNRDLLIDKNSGNLTPRGQSIINMTPMDRFGDFDELLGATLFLTSPASAFITGIVVPIDGGFSSFSGV